MLLMAQDESEAFWSYRDLLVFLGLAVPSMLGGTLLVKMALTALYISTPHKALELLPGEFLGYAFLYSALAFLFRVEYQRPFWRSLGWRWPARPPAPVILASGVPLALTLAVLGSLLHTPDAPTPMKELLNDRFSLIVAGIFAVTLGPVCEELAFRGLMQPLFIRSLGTAPGIFLSGLGFGLVHLPQYGFTWQHGLLITMAGVAFGWMRWISGSTLGSTLMHSAYNLTLFLGIFAGGDRIPHSW
jgi:membrane protease YdiL (CAAX protease family)